jgi:hypothetical protein
MSFVRCGRLIDMTEQDTALKPLDVLIGAWSTEATHPLVEEVVTGDVTFEWLAGERFLIQRSHNDHELFPDAISVIGAAGVGGGLVMEYFDSRGVRRTYDGSLEGGVLRFSGEFPEFAQRFSVTLGRERFESRSQLARAPGEWEDDLIATYQRRA